MLFAPRYALAILAFLGCQLHSVRADADDAAILAEAKTITHTAIEQQRVFLNCSYLQPPFQAKLKADWQKDVDIASSMLLAHPATRTYGPELQREGAIDGLMMKDATPAALESFCNKHLDLLEAYARLDFVFMRFALDDVLKKRD
ncbi:MAG: hypothetical protein K2P80_10230 [Beijerinckiaceae bacterium]|nr:hypothetical protein [Beijerinckiaceae bacterium]